MKVFYTLLFFSSFFFASAQVTLNPAFVTQNDSVEVIYDATQGSAGLVGVSPVYMHTGAITNLSTGPSDWRHVQGNWGTDDAKVKMTPLGNNLHSLKMHIKSFYNIPANETAQQLAFVFRNVDGTKEGKTATGGDIYVALASGAFQSGIFTPVDFQIADLNDTIDIKAQSSSNATLEIFLGTTSLISGADTNHLQYRLPVATYGTGNFDIILRTVYNGNISYDTVSYLARAGVNIGVDTTSYEEGITIVNDSTVFLKLRAPIKDFVYVVGSFNNWTPNANYEMYRTPDGKFWWIFLEHLDPQKEHLFQYYINEEGLLVADPYSEKILDSWNDHYIPSSVYPNLQPYPSDKTSNAVTALNTVKPQYQWQNNNYHRPAEQDLVIYELLIRDFENGHTYQNVIDRLPYLDSLGINAIELMPVMEFEGNESWGYNPMFFMAPDKYYGTPEMLKTLIDSCHGRGIAVIFDIVLNHAFGQCPLVRMYFENGAPTAQNPWFNQVAKHEFNVGYDFNHESEATKVFAKKVLQHWLNEYNADGYRIDLSKGLTQKNTLGSVSAMGQYDQSRIDILTRLRNNIHEVDASAYVILEHFADNNEEVELASRGFMLWGNENHQFNEATMGYASNISGAHHSSSNFAEKKLVAYMESHDEERLMYKNMQFGNSNGSYNTKDLATALERMELAAAFFYTMPGPRMLWQFGELGYDFSINRCPDGTIDEGCRLANKPIRWDYLQQQNRRKLYVNTANIIALRHNYPSLFNEGTYNSSLGIWTKTLSLKKADSSLVVYGNFDVTAKSFTLNMPASGWWYDYKSGDSLNISGLLNTTLAPGEYHILTNFKTVKTFNNVGLNEAYLSTDIPMVIYPNPAEKELYISMDATTKPIEIVIYALDGQPVWKKHLSHGTEGTISLGDLSKSNFPKGIYILELTSQNKSSQSKIILK